MHELLNSTAFINGCLTDVPATTAQALVPSIAPEPDSASLPRRVDRRRAAELVSHFVFPATPRALEDWDLNWVVIAGKACCETNELFAVAQQKLAAGRRVKRRLTDPHMPSRPTRPLAA